MHMKNWKQELLTIPNLLSLLRLALIPVYVSVYLRASYHTAGLIIGFSCLTDAMDGQIARHFNMISTLGKILDPLADKLTQLALSVCLSLRYPALVPVLALLAVKELAQLALGIAYLRRGKILPGALMAGKVCTAVLFVSFLILVVFPRMDPGLVKLIAWTDSVFLLISFASYLSAYLGRNTLVQDVKEP